MIFASNPPPPEMQTLIRMDMIVIENYYHKTKMDEDVNWMELTHLKLQKSLTFGVPFSTSSFTSKFLIVS